MNPDFVNLLLGEGESATVDVSLSPDSRFAGTADIIFAIDISGSMQDAHDWLVHAVTELENNLSALQFSNQKYGLVIFGDPLQSQLQKPFSIALGNIGGTETVIDPFLVPYADNSSQLWGTLAQLKAAIEGIEIASDLEPGYEAISRIFDPAPQSLVNEFDIPIQQQYPYQFRADALTSVVLVSDEQTDYFDETIRQDILAQLVNNPALSLDDISFTSITASGFSADDQLGNINLFHHDLDEDWQISANHWEVWAVSKDDSPMAIFDWNAYHTANFRSPFVSSWSIVTELTIQDLGDDFGERARVLFGTDAMQYNNGKPNLPSDFWYLEVDAETNQWSIGNSNSENFPLHLHQGTVWPEIDADQSIQFELRQILQSDHNRFDLFIDGSPVATTNSDITNYSSYLPGTNTIGFFGLGTIGSAAKFDRIEVRVFQPEEQSAAANLLPNETTPLDFGDSDAVAKIAFVNDFGIEDGSSFDPDIMGINYRGIAYRMDGVGQFDRLINPEVVHASGHQDLHYHRLSQKVFGSTWNLSLLEQADSNTLNSFTDAFAESLATELRNRSITVQSESSILTDVVPIVDPFNPTAASFRLTLTGIGASHVFDLEFVHVDSTTTELGKIPTFVTSAYTHDFEVFDFENDIPFWFEFDPEFVDENGQLITHGAELVDSGREHMFNDRFRWLPPEVTEITEFQFRIIVHDSAGMQGSKDWSVTVYPADETNNLPTIDLTGLIAIQHTHTGFTAAILPAAQELRSFEYQVIASDVDPQDAGNLTYYLASTDSGFGPEPPPSWLKIDRNTGRIHGRPPSSALGSHFFTVVVSDGRLYRHSNGEIVAGKTSQIFEISVNSRSSINTAPTITSIADNAIRYGEPWKVSIDANDVNQDLLAYSLIGAPAGMTIDDSIGEINWTPTLGQANQLHPITVSVSDGRASSNLSFQVFVAGQNRAPQIDIQIQDSVTYLDWSLPIQVSDPDGDMISTSLIAAPLGASITQSPQSGDSTALTWPASAIQVGTHRFVIRSFDNAGAVTEREIFVNFRADGVPHFIRIDEPDVWRVGTLGQGAVFISSHVEITDFTPFELDFDSQNRGINLDLANRTIENDPPSDGFYVYKIPYSWTPDHDGSYSVKLWTQNSAGTKSFDFDFDVKPDVTLADNRAPVFADQFLGPFELGQFVVAPINVADPDGHQFSLEILPGSALPAGPLENNTLLLEATETGLFNVTLRATETDGFNASSEFTYTFAVTDNSSPAIRFPNPGQAELGADFGMGFILVEPNTEDEVQFQLNAEAVDAGLSIIEITDPTFSHQLVWSSADITTWTLANGIPNSLPIEIVVTDNHGGSSRVNFDVPIVDPTLVPLYTNYDYDYQISAGREWNLQFPVDNPGGHQLTYQIYMLNNSSAPLPAGLSISSDGFVQWNPPLELLQTGGTTDPETLDPSKLFQFEVHVSRPFGGGTATDIVGMHVTLFDPLVLDPYIPEIDTLATPVPNAAILGQELVYEPILKPTVIPEHEGQPTVWMLESAPLGMTIDESTGVVRWTPTSVDVGDQIEVVIRVASNQDTGSILEFVLDVNGSNLAPIFTTTFPTVWGEVSPFLLDVAGHDPEGHHLRYSISKLDGSPVDYGMTIDAETGQIKWTSPIEGQYEILVRVSERHQSDSFFERSLALTIVDTITDGPVNYEPLIQGMPLEVYATTGTNFSFDFDVSDPDQGVAPLIFEIADSSSSSATIDQNGIFSWTPQQGEDGIQTFQIKVTDTSPHTGIDDNEQFLTFHLNAIENFVPILNVPSSLSVQVATPFVYHLDATDPDKQDNLTYSFVGTVPDGMTINSSTGTVRWYVTDSISNYTETVIVRATDPWGAFAEQSIDLNVEAVDETLPWLNFYLVDIEGNLVAPSQIIEASSYRDYKIWLDIRDNRGINLPDASQNGSWRIDVNNTGSTGQPAGSNVASHGVAWDDYSTNNYTTAPKHGLWGIEFGGSGLNQGVLEIELEYYDDAGNRSTRYSRYYVNDSATANVGKILNLNDQSPAITDRFEVQGNTNFSGGNYDLKLTSIDDPSDFIYLAKDKPATVTETLIGVVDGTMIPSGQYRLHLEVRCGQNCIRAVDERIIEVQNEARLGNLELALTDLDVSLGGVPIPLIRTYNSGLTNEFTSEDGGQFNSDFSAGWNLNFLQARVSVAHPNGLTTALDQPFTHGTRVFATMPDGTVHRFTFDPIERGSVNIPFLNADPEFRSQLYALDFDEKLRFTHDETTGNYFEINNGQVLIPAAFGSALVLQTENGLKYIFDIHNGKLLAIEDQNDGRVEIIESDGGATITIQTKNTGINNQEGQIVTNRIVIKRELKPGSMDEYRIVSISDPINEDDPATIQVDEDRQVLFNYDDQDMTTHWISNLSELVRRDGTTEGYEYDDLFAHHLTGILDHDDIEVFSAQYYQDIDGDGDVDDDDRTDEKFGRLHYTANSNSEPTENGFDFQMPGVLPGHKVRSTNLTGVQLEEVVNTRGDVVRTVQLVHDSALDTEKRYLVSVTRYKPLSGRIVGQSKPFYVTGSANRFTTEPAEPDVDPLAWVSTTSYYDDGRVQTVTDGRGGFTTYVYDDENGIFQTITPFTIQWQITNPRTGRLLETYTTSTTGNFRKQFNRVRYEYSDFGQQVAQIQILPDQIEVELSRQQFNDDGQLVWTRSPGSPTQYFAYNENGFRTHSWTSVAATDSSFITVVQWEGYSAIGKDNGSLLVSDEDNQLRQVEFTINGPTEYDLSNFASLDALIHNADSDPTIIRTGESTILSNYSEELIQSRELATDSIGNQVWLISRIHRTTSQGLRIEYSTSQFEEGTPDAEITGTKTYFDAEGRVVRTDQLLGLNIGITVYPGEAGYAHSSLVSEGTLLSYNTTEYDAQGRAYKSSSHPTGNSGVFLTTESFYNLKGQITETRSESWDANGHGKNTFVSRIVYDDQDRVEYQTDSYLDQANPIVFATRTLYNQAGQSYGSIRLKDIVVTIDANYETSVASGDEGQQLYQTTSYYNISQLETSVDGEGNETNYEYDSLGRQVATIGPVVLVNGVEMRHRSESVYDNRGRVYLTRSNIVHNNDGNHDESKVQETRFEFDDDGRVFRTTYADGSFGEVRFDALGRTVAESQRVSAGTTLIWSASDNSFQDQNGSLVSTRTMSYDAQGRMVAVELPAIPNSSGNDERPIYQYSYDHQGQQTQIVDPLGRETELRYNELGQQIERTLPLGFGVDGIKGTTDDGAAEAFTETFEYDQRGRRSLHISFEGVYTVPVYDDVTGRQIETHYFQDAATYNFGTGVPNEKWIYGFDDYGRTTSVTFQQHVSGSNYQTVRTETRTYTDEGYLESTTNDEGTIHYQYDDFGRMTKKSFYSREFTPANSNDFDTIIDYTYDSLGRLSTVEVIERGDTIVDVDPGTAGDQPDLTVYGYDLLGNLDTVAYSNGLIHEYDYDSLNQLDELYHWVDEDGDSIRGTDEIRALFDYSLREDGKRIGSVETYYDAAGTLLTTNTFAWNYDAAGRLIQEVTTSNGDSSYTFDEYTLDWEYDLTGNRTSQVKSVDGSVVETINYVYDSNDRLGTETKTVGSVQTTTTYTFDNTQQTSKVVTTNGQSTTYNYQYDLQGRMSAVITDKPGESSSKVTYQYDSNGNRVATEEFVDTNGNGTFEASEIVKCTEYLTDSENHTGYSQVLQETEFDANGVAVKKTIYSVGHDQISQTVLNRVDTDGDGTPDAWDSGQTDYFGTDGHGSVRVLYDWAAAIVQDVQNNLPQIYHFDAYGNLLNFDTATPLTNYLYSGEAFDFNIGQQYLRARWYDASNGRFNRLDPYFGNSSDPQSFHKYAYVHSDPISYVDPSGKFIASFGGVVLNAGLRAGLLSAGIGAVFRAPNIIADIVGGKDLDEALWDYAKGIAFDFAVGAVLGGAGNAVLRFASNGVKLRSLGQSVSVFRLGRLPWSVWKHTGSVAANKLRGLAIEKSVLSRAASFLGQKISSFPVIDDFILKNGRGIATSIKSLDLTAKSYQSGSKVLSQLNTYAKKLQQFSGATRKGVTVGPGGHAINDKVLVVAFEQGTATGLQAEAIKRFIREAGTKFPDVKVVFQFIV
ncbi:MAG: putative Ig domain-containing protein [Planctomycetota bacterium]